jgi:hypothetical protein
MDTFLYVFRSDRFCDHGSGAEAEHAGERSAGSTKDAGREDEVIVYLDLPAFTPRA